MATRRKTTRKTKKTRKTTKSKKRKPFGGMTVCFKGCKDPAYKIFGSTKLSPSKMNQKLWMYIKRKKLKD